MREAQKSRASNSVWSSKNMRPLLDMRMISFVVSPILPEDSGCQPAPPDWSCRRPKQAFLVEQHVQAARLNFNELDYDLDNSNANCSVAKLGGSW